MRGHLRTLAAPAVLVAAVLALLAPALPASAAPQAPPSTPAAPAPPPAAAARSTFGIRPATATAPDSRTALTYTATPGATIRDFVSVSNIGEQPLVLGAYATDAFNTEEGGFDVLPSARKPVDVGAWTAVAQHSVTVAGHAAVIVPITLTVPANAQPGDHVGGVVASLVTERTDAKGDKVAVEERVGARIYLRVTGPLHPGLAVDGLTADYHQNLNPLGEGSATLSFAVRNTGNIRLSGHQRVEVRTPWGASVAVSLPADLPELLPGNRIRFSATVPAVLPAGWLTASVHLVPAVLATDAQAAHPVPVDGEATFAAVPWSQLLVLLVLVGLVLLWLRRRRRRTPPPAGPALPTKEKAHA